MLLVSPGGWPHLPITLTCKRRANEAQPNRLEGGHSDKPGSLSVLPPTHLHLVLTLPFNDNLIQFAVWETSQLIAPFQREQITYSRSPTEYWPQWRWMDRWTDESIRHTQTD